MKWITTFIMSVVVATTAFAQPKVGEKVPNIVVAGFKGGNINLQQQKAKLILIDFWASWCAPCRASIKKLKPIYNQYNTKGFEVFAVSIDETSKDWKAAIAADKTSWVHGIDNGGWYGKIATQWKLESIPATFLINDKGIVVAVDPDEATLKTILEQQLTTAKN